MGTLIQDVRYSVRTLWKSRGFTAVAIVTLALGIGASTAIFSVIENVLMNPFPYPDARRMIFPQIHDTAQQESGGRAGYNSEEFLQISGQNHVFDGVVAAGEEEFLYKHGEGTERLYGAHVTPGTFEFFGVPPLLGRALQPADYEPGAPPVFVMRYKAWVNQFSADPNLLNQTIVLNGTPRTLVGIMPPRFGWYEADVMIPEKPVHGTTQAGGELSIRWFLLGHLRPGVSTHEAEADLSVIANRLSKLFPQEYPTRFTVQVKAIGDSVVGRLSATLYTTLAAVVLLLLIGCANVANLMLARAAVREKEFAVRAVLGAGRARLARQLLVESLILALSGAALGTLIAWGGLKSIVAAMPQNMIPVEAVIELNPQVLLFTLGVAVVTALIFGLVPALRVSRRDLNDPLRDSGKGTNSGGRHGRLQDAVVVFEVALSLTLLVGAGLLMRSFVALREEHLGFQPDHILVARLPLPQERYKTSDDVKKFYRQLLARVKALPGVLDAAEASAVPPSGGRQSDIEIPGKTHPEKWTSLFEFCSESYFPVLRIELKDGRTFTEAEVTDGRRLAVVNEAFVRKYFGNENPIGQHVEVVELNNFPGTSGSGSLEIVGVTANVKNEGLQDAIVPQIWMPYTVAGLGARGILVRTSQDPLALMDSLRHEIWATDSGVAMAYGNSLEGYISETSYAGPRFGFILMTIFGCVGLVLVTIGVYSVLAYTTARRTHEIGIRMALGAEGSHVQGMVIRSGLRVVGFGVLIGLGASLTLGRLIETQLWKVQAYDPATLAGVTLLLLATGIIACWIPARRASRVDPLVALRYE